MHLSLAKQKKKVKYSIRFLKNFDRWVLPLIQWQKLLPSRYIFQLWWKHTCADPHSQASLLGCLSFQNPTLMCRTGRTNAQKGCYLCDHQQDSAEYHSRVIKAAKKSAMVKCRIEEPPARRLQEDNEKWGYRVNCYTPELLLFLFHIPRGSFESSSCTDRKTFQLKTTQVEPHPYRHINF